MVRREAVPSVLRPTAGTAAAARVANSPPAPSSPGRVDSLDSLRGIAALIVVLYHCTLTYFAGNLPNWIKYSPLRLLVDGYGSVLVFFALSGFVLFLTFKKADRFAYYPYIVKRFMRLYPPFAAAILGSALLYALVGPQAIPQLGVWFNQHWDVAPSLAVIAGHLAMTDRTSLQGLDNVMWSLCHEARISLFFPLIALCVRKNWYVSVVAAFAVSTASGHIDALHPNGRLYDPFATLQYVFLFTAGAALALNAGAVRRRLESAPRWARIALWATALGFIGFASSSRHLGEITDCAAILIVALCLADGVALRALAHGFPRWLGRISYSLYLVHMPILLTMVHFFWGKLPLGLILIATVPLSLLAADLGYRLVEKPAMDLGRRLAALGRPATVAALALAALLVAGARPGTAQTAHPPAAVATLPPQGIYDQGCEPLYVLQKCEAADLEDSKAGLKLKVDYIGLLSNPAQFRSLLEFDASIGIAQYVNVKNVLTDGLDGTALIAFAEGDGGRWPSRCTNGSGPGGAAVTNREFIRCIALTLRDSPAFAGWYLYDEPGCPEQTAHPYCISGMSPSEDRNIAPVAAYIGSIDKHPIIGVNNGVAYAQHACEGSCVSAHMSDVFAWLAGAATPYTGGDYYPVGCPSGRNCWQRIDDLDYDVPAVAGVLAAAHAPEKLEWVGQAFDWAEEGTCPVSTCSFPSAAQMRLMRDKALWQAAHAGHPLWSYWWYAQNDIDCKQKPVAGCDAAERLAALTAAVKAPFPKAKP